MVVGHCGVLSPPLCPYALMDEEKKLSSLNVISDNRQIGVRRIVCILSFFVLGAFFLSLFVLGKSF